MKYLVAKGHPKFLFLIGKGLEVSQGFYRKTSLLPTDFRDLVPSAGMPGSDMAFTAGLHGTTFEPAVPTGRLTASTPAQVAAYLNKVKESEALAFEPSPGPSSALVSLVRTESSIARSGSPLGADKELTGAGL